MLLLYYLRQNAMADDFLKVDLHVHTPSSDCYKYKGNRDDEYYSILRIAKTRRLKVIAITDHNSIEGYKRLKELKEQLYLQKASLNQITDSEQSKILLEQIDRLLFLFEDILILPGIEFEVSNCIHLLVIFNENTIVEQIEKFLLDGGYSPENFGLERPATLAKWDIFGLFEAAKRFDCIIIDAHSDSDKGILKTIPPSAARAHCFSSPQLNAICCHNEEEKSKLQIALDTAKEYSRQFPLAFVRFSDAHSSDKVGCQVTWVKMADISFESLKLALSNPSEMVSIEEPSLSSILNYLVKLEKSFGIRNLDDRDLIKRFICALINSNGGYVLIGVSENKKSLSGISYSHPKDETPRREELLTLFREIDPRPKVSVSLYPLQNDRAIFSIGVPRGDNLTGLIGDGQIYSIKNKKLIILSSSEVQQLLEERISKEIEQKVSAKIDAVENECRLVKHLFNSMPLIRHFEKNSRLAKFTYERKESINLEVTFSSKLIGTAARTNGTSRGNIFLQQNFYILGSKMPIFVIVPQYS